MGIDRRQLMKILSASGAIALGGGAAGLVGQGLAKRQYGQQCGPGQAPPGTLFGGKQKACGGGGGGGGGYGPNYNAGQSYVNTYGAEIGVINSNADSAIQSYLSTAWAVYKELGVTESVCTDVANASNLMLKAYANSHTVEYFSQIITDSTPTIQNENYLLNIPSTALQSHVSYLNSHGCAADYDSLSTGYATINMAGWPLQPGPASVQQNTWYSNLSLGTQVLTDAGLGVDWGLSQAHCGELSTFSEGSFAFGAFYAGIGILIPVTAPVLIPAGATWGVIGFLGWVAHKELC